MYRISRTTAVATIVAVVFHGSLSTLAAPEATIKGTVEVPCDPSRVSEVAVVYIRPVSGGAVATVVVDSTTGKFHGAGFTEGEYEFIVIGTDGKPLSPEPTKLVLQEGLNAVVLSMQPPGCGEQEADPGQSATTPREKDGLKDWQLTLIYVGVVGGVILALSDDDEEPASPFLPGRGATPLSD
jgi:hypothetical protein